NADIGEQRPNDFLIDVHRERLATLHHRDGVGDDVSENIPEEIAEDESEHRQQKISDRRGKVAAHLLAANDPGISHCLAPESAGSAGGAASGASATVPPVSWRKTSSRLTEVERSSLRSQPDSTTARARSPRVKFSFRFSSSNT